VFVRGRGRAEAAAGHADQSLRKLDFLTFALMAPGARAMLVAVLAQGYLRWWFDTPWLAWLLIAALVLIRGLLHRAPPAQPAAADALAGDARPCCALSSAPS
jgi:hypothetical protein